MTRGPFFFAQFAGSWRLEPDADSQGRAVRVTFRYTFQTRWAWLRAVLDPIIQRVFLRDIRGRLAGLKRGAERDGLLRQLTP